MTESGKVSSESDDSEDKEDDDNLFWTNDILSRLHQRFYLHLLKNESTPGKVDSEITVPHILEQMRKEVLRGCKVVLSGLIPLGEHSRWDNKSRARPPIARYVEDLGGTIVSDVTEDVTHVIAARVGTQKVFKGSRVPGCAVVNVDWLMWCYWSISTRDVTSHLLLPMRIRESGLEPTAKSRLPANSNGESVDEDQNFIEDLERSMLGTAKESSETSTNLLLTANDDESSDEDEEDSEEDDVLTAYLEKSILTEEKETAAERSSKLLLDADDDEESTDEDEVLIAK